MPFQFEDFVLDPDRRELRRAGMLVAVEPQVFDLIDYLIRNRNHVVTRDNLLDAVWNGRVVSESTLASRINAARRALNDSGDEQRLIRTVARKGLRFVGTVEDAKPPDDAAAASSSVASTIEEASDVKRLALPLPDRPAIAVLPFTNLSGDPEQEYFSDGISEDIITALSKLRWFFVIARNSSFIYKGKAVHMKQVAEELGVALRGRGQRAKERRPRSHHGAAQRRRDRQPCLGGTLRPRPHRRIRCAGRDHRSDRRRDRAAALCRRKLSLST